MTNTKQLLLLLLEAKQEFLFKSTTSGKGGVNSIWRTRRLRYGEVVKQGELTLTRQIGIWAKANKVTQQTPYCLLLLLLLMMLSTPRIATHCTKVNQCNHPTDSTTTTTDDHQLSVRITYYQTIPTRCTPCYCNLAGKQKYFQTEEEEEESED